MEILFIIVMGVLGRLSGNGFGQQWGVAWLPEVLHSVPYGVALGWAVHTLGGAFFAALPIGFVGVIVSSLGMQSATWMFLRWEGHSDPNMQRSSTLKPFIDRVAALFGYKLGDEGYAWIAAGIKGFIIGLPVGGIVNAVFWALGYEIGSHARGRIERFGIDPHGVSEFMSAAGGGISIVIFIEIVKLVTGA